MTGHPIFHQLSEGRSTRKLSFTFGAWQTLCTRWDSPVALEKPQHRDHNSRNDDEYRRPEKGGLLEHIQRRHGYFLHSRVFAPHKEVAESFYFRCIGQTCAGTTPDLSGNRHG